MLLRTELATGFTLASIAETKCQIGDDEGGAYSTERAEEVYSRLGRLLSDPNTLNTSPMKSCWS